MRRALRRAALLGLLCLGCGCPQKANGRPPEGPATHTAPSDAAPNGDAVVVPDEASPEVPAGPAGPVGPASAESRTPAPEDNRPQLELRRTTTLTIGAAKVEVWVADGPRSRRLGLMHVRELPPNTGMIFAYPDVRRRSFWMRNTYVPLSLAYISADGRIEQILDMEPLTTTSHPSKASVMYVLEVNQGWFAKNGVKEGMPVRGVTELRGF